MYDLLKEYFEPPVLVVSHLLVSINLILTITLAAVAVVTIFLFVPLGIVCIAIVSERLFRTYSIISEESTKEKMIAIQKANRKGRDAISGIIWGITAILFSYITLCLPVVLVSFLLKESFFTAIVAPQGSILILVATIYVASPLAYPIGGLCYQTVHALRSFAGYFLHSSSVDQEFETNATIRQIRNRKSPFCLSTGLTGYIFIPEHILNSGKFGQAELEAIVAHEEKHLLEGEAFLFFIMPAFSVLTFTGQNVIYGLLNFRRREYEADEYAKQKVSEEAIISALETIKQEFDVEGASEASSWQTLFSMFYGTFAHSTAHPPLTSRINRLS